MFRDALIIYRKELKNLAKDRRTLMIIIILPLIILPAIFGTIGTVTKRQAVEAADTVYSLWIDNISDSHFTDILSQRLQYVKASSRSAADLSIVFPDGYQPGDQAEVEVYYQSTSSKSTFAEGRIASALEAYSQLLAGETLRANNLTFADIHTISEKRVDTAPKEAQGAGILPALLPYLILIYVFSGSMNIGLDTTAGEKERGSLASVLVNQVSRTSIATGKILYVVTASLINSVSSFIGIMIAFRVAGGGMGSSDFAANLAIFSVGNVIGLLITLLSISTLAASIVVLIGSFAKNMKEGGSYILPVYLVVIMIGVASMQMDATGRFFFIPLVNTVFVLKEILTGQMVLTHFLGMIVINAIAAAVFVALTSRMFNSEKILNTT